jgi:RecJ-like exonuclease
MFPKDVDIPDRKVLDPDDYEDIEPKHSDDATEMVECPECEGRGTVDVSVRAPRVLECACCDGTGIIPADDLEDDESEDEDDPSLEDFMPS